MWYIQNCVRNARTPVEKVTGKLRVYKTYLGEPTNYPTFYTTTRRHYTHLSVVQYVEEKR